MWKMALVVYKSMYPSISKLSLKTYTTTKELLMRLVPEMARAIHLFLIIHSYKKKTKSKSAKSELELAVKCMWLSPSVFFQRSPGCSPSSVATVVTGGWPGQMTKTCQQIVSCLLRGVWHQTLWAQNEAHLKVQDNVNYMQNCTYCRIKLHQIHTHSASQTDTVDFFLFHIWSILAY